MSRCHARWAFLVVLAAAGILTPRAAQAQRPRFSVSAPIAIDAGTPGPQAVAVGDLTKDGRPDIVVVSADQQEGPVAVLINQGNGTFAAPQFVSDPDSELGTPVAVAIADVGSVSGGPDQNNDIIVIDEDGGFLILFGDGAGNFVIEGALNEIDGIDVPVGVAVGDFDGENGPDLAIIDNEGDNGGEVFFLCNTGQAGVFEACATLALDSGGEMPIDVGVGDFNGDGKADVVVLNQGTAAGEGNVGLFIGDGGGAFSLPRQATFPIANEPRDFAVANLNPGEDSIDDVAVAEYEVLSDNNVAILLGGTTGAIFTRADKALLEIATTALTVGSFAGNDSPDLAGANDPAQAGSSIITVATGDGTGAFQDPQQGGSLAGGGLAMVAGRLNDDALDDLVVLNLAGTEVRIALNTSTGGTVTPGTPGPGSPTVPPTPTPTRVVTPELEGCEVPISSASGPVELVAAAQADFDRDGTPDIAVVDRLGAQVFVMLTDSDELRGPDASCTFPRTTPYSVAASPVSIAVSDLNGDSRVDIAVATSAGVTILLASGNEGDFEFLRTISTGTDPRSVAIDDFDHDGVTDLAVVNHGSNNVVILFGTGDQEVTFAERSARPPFTVPGAIIVVAADLNGDGWADLGVASDLDNSVRALLQNPLAPGLFPGTQPNPVTLTGGVPTAMTAAQTTSAPSFQLLVTTRAANGVGSFVAIRRSGNVFSQGTPVVTGGRPTAIGTGEFVGGSGPTDALVTSSVEDSVWFFPGNSDGTFGGALSTSPVGRAPSALVSGDFDADGKADVAVANMGAGTVTLLLSSRVPPTPTPTTTSTAGPTNSPTATGMPGPSQTATVGTPGPTSTPKDGAFSLSSCSIVPVAGVASNDASALLIGGAMALWLRRRRAKKQ